MSGELLRTTLLRCSRLNDYTPFAWDKATLVSFQDTARLRTRTPRLRRPGPSPDHPSAHTPHPSNVRNDRLEIRDDITHGRPLARILMPHALHKIDRFRAPVFPQSSNGRTAALLSNHIVDVMLIMAFPRIFLLWSA